MITVKTQWPTTRKQIGWRVTAIYTHPLERVIAMLDPFQAKRKTRERRAK